MQVLNSNIPSLNTQHATGRVQDEFRTSLQRLSTGARINSAKDDAAGLAIASRFEAGVRGLNRAARNASDAISLIQTAEGGAAAVANNLQRVRELVVQAGNATNSASDRKAIQSEINALVAANFEVASDTEFNNIKVLAKDFQAQFQIGDAAGDVLDVSFEAPFPIVSSSSMVELEIEQVSLSGQPAAPLAANSLTLNGVAVGASVAGAAPGQSASSAYAVAAAITNAGAGLPNVISASALTATSGTAGGATAIGAGAFLINGAAIGPISGANAAATAASAAAAIANEAATTGVTASAVGNVLTLTAADGRDIVIGENVGGTAAALGFATGTRRGTITVTNTAAPSNTFIVVGGAAPENAGLAAGNFASAGTGATALVPFSSSGYAEAAIDVSSDAGVADALTYLDEKIDEVSTLRSTLGATQHRIEHTLNGIASREENMSAARSRIVDADYAEESRQLMRQRILQQAGAAMLAQANTEKRRALILLL
jgi:flagellin